MRWGFVGTDTSANGQLILLVRRGSLWQIPQGEVGSSVTPRCAMERYHSIFLDNYRFAAEPMVWHENILGHCCYSTCVRKVRPSLSLRKPGGPDAARFYRLENALGLLLDQVTQAAITQLLAERVMPRRS